MPNIKTNPIHLGLGATAISEPEFSGMPWYAAYAERHATDGVEGRLVMMGALSAPWTMWEMHPLGAEVVLCMSGEIVLTQQIDGGETQTTLKAGDYAINPPGVWHTADVDAPATALFITAGKDTQHRPR